jgi:hypothetical protein
VGKPVASIRRSLATVFSIPADAEPFVGGSVVDGQFRLRAGDSLEFLVGRGENDLDSVYNRGDAEVT